MQLSSTLFTIQSSQLVLPVSPHLIHPDLQHCSSPLHHHPQSLDDNRGYSCTAHGIMTPLKYDVTMGSNRTSLSSTFLFALSINRFYSFILSPDWMKLRSVWSHDGLWITVSMKVLENDCRAQVAAITFHKVTEQGNFSLVRQRLSDQTDVYGVTRGPAEDRTHKCVLNV